MQQVTKISTPATNQHCGWPLYFDDIAYTHSPVMVLVSAVSLLQSARKLTWTLLQWNLLSKRITTCVGFINRQTRHFICLRLLKFKRQVLKYLSWALSTVFLAFDDHFSLHKNNQNVCHQTRFLRPKYANYAFRGRGSAPDLVSSLSFFSVLCTVDFC